MDTVLTFHTTHSVITGEAVLAAAGLPVEAAGIPAAISAGCGLSLRIEEKNLKAALSALQTENISTQGVYIQKDATYHRLEDEEN